MIRKYVKKGVVKPLIPAEIKPDYKRVLTFDEELERVEICAAIFHSLPLDALRELYKKAQEIAININ